MYSKLDCPLCLKAKKVLEELNEEIPLTIEEIDIYEDDVLLEKYQIMIPVIEIDGEEVTYGIINKDTVRKRLLKKNAESPI
ncbi:glutaredoxin family protein [Cytobacillus sp. S13-E01]|uniref:glutaredoxin family protein n=1 Tax=Cytobacillus sp. S13-E01 TaxID=3031326 RepID=UPI0023D8AE4C|nr:glutaredoxin family protein [Cytobacillus sp. S13-E01]MDF0728308.1 glutaredoxin family protein [Cytobacillus sp. S13-E01]